MCMHMTEYKAIVTSGKFDRGARQIEFEDVSFAF